jgi:hypothetical protein
VFSFAKALKRYLRLNPGKEYQISLPLPAFALGRLADLIVRELIPTSVWKSDFLSDFKGRDALDLIGNDWNPEEKPDGDELLYLNGKWFAAEPAEEGARDKLKTHQFEFRIGTPFHAFLEENHIQFRKEESRKNAPEGVPGWALGSAIPIELDKLRFGMNIYQPHSQTSIFGTSATVTEALLIEADQNVMALKITVENPERPPLRRFDTFNRLGGILGRVFNFNLAQDYSIKIQSS